MYTFALANRICMPFTSFLKKLLIQFVEVYETAFSKTFIRAILWTVLCFAISQLLATYCTYDLSMQVQPVSVLSFFVLRFSYHDTYSYVDLTKTVFIFLVSIFSINLIRKITLKDILYLLTMLLVCALLDCALFRLRSQMDHAIDNKHLLLWVDGMIFLFRIYFPLILFALCIQLCTSKINFTFKKIAYLFVALWLFNEISYEFIMLLRANVFDLILAAFQIPAYRYVGESILGIPLIASCFLGFYCGMTAPFKLLEKE